MKKIVEKVGKIEMIIKSGVGSTTSGMVKVNGLLKLEKGKDY